MLAEIPYNVTYTLIGNVLVEQPQKITGKMRMSPSPEFHFALRRQIR